MYRLGAGLRVPSFPEATSEFKILHFSKYLPHPKNATKTAQEAKDAMKSDWDEFWTDVKATSTSQKMLKETLRASQSIWLEQVWATKSDPTGFSNNELIHAGRLLSEQLLRLGLNCLFWRQASFDEIADQKLMDERLRSRWKPTAVWQEIADKMRDGQKRPRDDNRFGGRGAFGGRGFGANVVPGRGSFRARRL